MTRNGQGFPINFRDTFLVERSTYTDPPAGNADWVYLKGRGLPYEATAQWPSPILRRSTVTSEAARAVEVLPLHSELVVTGYRNNAGDLKLRSWSKLGDGDLSLSDVVVGPAIKQVALAKPSVTSDFVTAVRHPDNTLELIEWDSFLNQESSTVSAPVYDVDITPSPHLPGLVTAARTTTNALQV
jgi:hypothetical protein